LSFEYVGDELIGFLVPKCLMFGGQIVLKGENKKRARDRLSAK